MRKPMEETKEFSDTLLVAYLSNEGFQIKPKKRGNQVSFEVSGVELTKAIQRFYQNPPIPILDFCKSYRAIRSALFNMRGLPWGKEDGGEGK